MGLIGEDSSVTLIFLVDNHFEASSSNPDRYLRGRELF